MKLLEHLHGTGVVVVESGDEVRAKYDVRITRDEPDDRAGSAPATTFKHLAGRVWSDHDPYFVLSNYPKVLTLQMEDGRKFKFFHRDIDGNIGLNEWIG
jgi:hypothetical protein